MLVKRATPTETFPNTLIYEPMVISRGRFNRQADSKAITSTEPITTVGPKPSEETDLADQYSSLSTTGLATSTDKTVIPLTSTVSSDSSKSERREGNETVDAPDVPGKSVLSINDNPVEATDIPKVDEKVNIESSSNLNLMESGTTSIAPLGLLNDVKNDESSDQLEVVGVPEMAKRTEIIMKLQPSKDQEYKWLKETIHSMLEVTILKEETDNYVTQLYRRYRNLPVNEADNKVWTKYSRAIVESFMLEFCRNSPHYTSFNQSKLFKEEEYNSLFNTTLITLQRKRAHTAIQFAAPVRRAVDIYKAILDAPIGIVQSKCVADMPRWMCFAEYVVHLADQSETCEHIWYHAQVHLTILQSIRHAKGARDPAHEVIAEVDSRLAMDSKNDVDFLFDLIIKTLGDLRQKLKEPLYLEANLYSLIRTLQSEDKLNCLNIDQGW